MVERNGKSRYQNLCNRNEKLRKVRMIICQSHNAVQSYKGSYQMLQTGGGGTRGPFGFPLIWMHPLGLNMILVVANIGIAESLMEKMNLYMK